MVPSVTVILALLSVTESIVPGEENFLIKKYSKENASFLNEHQLQELLNNLFSCCHNHSSGNGSDGTNGINITAAKKAKISAAEMFNLWNVEDKKFNSSLLHYTCPLILNELDRCSCHNNASKVEVKATETKKPTTLETWGLGFIFVTVINLLSLVGAAIIPTTDKEFCKHLMMVMVGLAVGSLSGSSVFHLIPQAFNLAATDTHHDYLHVSLMVWMGIWAFFSVERILSLVKHLLESKNQHHEGPLQSTSAEAVSRLSSPTELISSHGDLSRVEPGSLQVELPRLQDLGSEIPCERRLHDHINFQTAKTTVTTVAWMVIFGDGFHNLIDGLSIGAAFSESILTGISISVAVMCEELPHELGDFAVLRNAGMSSKEAMLYNFLSALTCYLGLIFGILLGEFEASSYIFGFAGGMFLYISLVDMMSELNEGASNAIKVGVKSFLKIFCLQNLGMFSGATALYLLARYQNSISFN